MLPSQPERAPLPRGVYLLTPDWDDTERLLAVTRQALAAGVRTLQYRHKSATAPLRLAQARALRELTREYRAQLAINDDPDLAYRVDADFLHLGRDDPQLATARARAPGLGLGASCYADWDCALAAVRAGASYVAFGAVFASVTKPQAVRAPLSLLARARAAGLHGVAIGGIDAGNIGQVAAAGAAAAALIRAVYDAADPAAAAARLIEEFQRGANPA